MTHPRDPRRFVLALALALPLLGALAGCRTRVRPDDDPATAETSHGPAIPFDVRAAPADWNPEGIAWRDAAEGLAEAQAQNKPVMMVFHAEWCGHCRNYARIFHHPRLQELSRRFVMISVDTDRAPAIGRRYATDGAYLPRTYFLDPSGRHRAEIDASRQPYRYFFPEHDPEPTLAAMTRALR